MNHTILSIKQVHKSFGRKKVLQNLNLTINQGDLIYIKGHNGSGKSTLLKIICEILKQDSGTINRDPQTTIGALIENPAFIESKPI